jgi:hypothetical protein
MFAGRFCKYAAYGRVMFCGQQAPILLLQHFCWVRGGRPALSRIVLSSPATACTKTLTAGSMRANYPAEDADMSLAYLVWISCL